MALSKMRTHGLIPEMKNALYLADSWNVQYLRIYELRENLLPDFDRCPKEALLISKVPWLYTQSDDVGGYVTVGVIRWATNSGSLVLSVAENLWTAGNHFARHR